MSASQLRITNATTPEAQDEKTSEGSESRNSSFSGKVRLFRKCLVEKPMLFVTAFVFLVVIIWLLAAPDIPGITDRAWNREPKEQAEWKGQTEETKMTEALVETVTVSRRGQEDNTKKADTEKTEAKTAGQGRTDPFKQVKKEAVSEKEESEESKSAIGEKAAFRNAFTESEPAETAEPGTKDPVQETENWKEKIFGSDDGLVQDKQVFITGLSASEKGKLAFRESDFVKAVSTFLSSKRIDAKTVEFLRKMRNVQTHRAMAYTVMAGRAGHRADREHLLRNAQQGLLFGLVQLPILRKGGEVFLKLLLVRHTGQDHRHAGGTLQKTEGPGSDLFVGTHCFQLRFVLRGKVGQLAAAQGFHHPNGNAQLIQHLDLLLAVLECPVQIMLLIVWECTVKRMERSGSTADEAMSLIEEFIRSDEKVMEI